MRRLILHIGNRKVGSTSLQHILSKNPDALAAAGLYYPRMGRGQTGEAHHNIAYQFSEQYGARLNAGRGLLQDIIAEAEAQPLQTIVISTEALSLLTRHEVENLAAQLPWPTEVVLYLRRHDLWMHSKFNQHIKFGRWSLNIEEHLAKQFERDHFLALIERWRGVGTLRCFPTNPGDNVVTHFVTTYGVSGPLIEADVARNTSAPLKLIVAAHTIVAECRSAIDAEFRLGNHSVFALSRFFRGRPDWVPRYNLFSIEHARRIEARYSAEANEVARLSGQRFTCVKESEYAHYIAEPMAFAAHFDDEEAAFMARIKRASLHAVRS